MSPAEVRQTRLWSQPLISGARDAAPGMRRQQPQHSGHEFSPAGWRIYPLGDLVSHTVGYCNVDINWPASAWPQPLDQGPRQPVAGARRARAVRPKDELAQVIEQFNARGAAGIIMNAHTGEIVAMASLPDFDPNHPPSTNPKTATTQDKDRVFNKITSGEYELGSVFKIFNTAMALDSGVATMTSSFDARSGIKIGRFTIEDYHGKHRILSVPEIFMYSSNIGSARMALAAGGERQRASSPHGAADPVPVEFDKSSRGHSAVWRPVNVMTSPSAAASR